MLKQFRSLFVPTDQQGTIDKAYLSDLIMRELPQNNSGSIVIKTNVASALPYPFSTSQHMLLFLLKTLRTIHKGSLYIIDCGHDDIVIEEKFRSLKPLLDMYEVQTIDVESTPLTKFIINSPQTRIEELYIPRLWADASIRITLSTASVHKHHVETIYKGVYSSLIDLLPRNYFRATDSRRMGRTLIYREGYELFLSDMIQTISRSLPFYALTDLRQLGVTNEHSFFLKTQKMNYCNFSNQITDLERCICEKAGLLYYPSYLES